MTIYFYSNLKYLRKLYKLTQKKLANELKIERSSISRYENQDMEITLERLVKISNYFKIDLIDLVFKDLQNDKKVQIEIFVDGKSIYKN